MRVMRQRNLRRAARLGIGSMLLTLGLVGGMAGAQQIGAHVVGVSIRGIVDPFVADHVRRELLAEGLGDPGRPALLLQIDTPGGLDSSMREVVQAIANARAPVICYVSPQGARAASAGAFILMACPVAAMAPGTNVGAATPVGISGATLSAKAENDAAAYMRSLAERTGRDPGVAASFVTEARSISAEEALDLGMIDAIAPTPDALLDAVDGETVTLGTGEAVTLATAGLRVEARDLGGALGILHALLDPTLAFIFFWLGLLLLVLELLVPGHIFSGTIGTALLILSLVSFGALPVRLIGVLLLVASVIFFLLELQVPGLGIWSAIGVAALILGGWFLFDRSGGAGVSPWAIVPVAAVVALFFGFVVTKVLATRHLPAAQGPDTVIGREGVVLGAGLFPSGVVRVAAEEWKAVSRSGPIPGGAGITVTALDGLVLTVEPLGSEHAPAGGASPAQGGSV
jgi:membrane-bound serine protease (ClpP class)